MAQLQSTLPLSLGANEGNERISQRSSFTRDNAADSLADRSAGERGRDQFSSLLSQERQQHAARNAEDLQRRDNRSANNLADRDRVQQREEAQSERERTAERAAEGKETDRTAARNRDTEPTQRQPVETKPTDDTNPNTGQRLEHDGSDEKHIKLETDPESEAPDWLTLVAAMQAQLNSDDGEMNAELKAQVDELVKEMPDDIQTQLRQLFADVDGEALVQAFNQVFADLEAGASLSTEQLRAQLGQHIDLPEAMSDKALATLGLLLQPNSDSSAQLQLGLNAETAKQLTALSPSDLAVQLGNIRQALDNKKGTDPSVFIGNPDSKADMKASGDASPSDGKVVAASLKSADDKLGLNNLSSERTAEQIGAAEKTPRNNILGQANEAADASKTATASSMNETGQNKLSREEALLAAAQANAEGKSAGATDKVAAEVSSKDLSVDASKLVSNDNRNLTQAQQAAKDAQIQAKAPTSFAEAMRQSQQSLELNSQQAPQQLRERLMFMVNNGVQRAEIRLDPPDLGSMSIRVTVQNDQAQVNFQAQNPQAREMLEQAMPRLRELMEQQGLQLADSGVSEQHQQQADSNGAGTSQGEAGSDTAEDAAWQGEIALDNGEPLVPGRVDFFA